jgi:nicotinamidase-related amidase
MPATHRLTWRQGALLVIDVQEKLISLIPRHDLVVANAVRLIKGAQALNLPVWATEQYPKGLGGSVSCIAELIPHRAPKTTFHCCDVAELVEGLHGRGIRHVTLAGIETHVCVAQTALELLDMGFSVQVPADAVASRFQLDWEFALRRLERAGAVVSTTEAVLFEWVEGSDHPQFKAISNLIKEFTPPGKTETSQSRPF